MPCSSCPNSPIAPSVELVPELVFPSFNTNGSLQLTNTGNAFTDLASLIPFATSAINAYITSLAVQNKSTEPTFFNSPYLYSLSSNLVLGNYLESSFTEGILTATTYLVPYQSEFKIETATIVTFFNSETKILFFQIPKEFSYNSFELASVATVPVETGYHAQVQIPQSFIDKTIFGSVIIIDIDIVIPLVKPMNSELSNAKVNVSATSCDFSNKIKKPDCSSITNETECISCYGINRSTRDIGGITYAGCEKTLCYWDSTNSKCSKNGSCKTFTTGTGNNCY